MQYTNDRLLVAGLMLATALSSNALADSSEQVGRSHDDLLVLEGDILSRPAIQQRGIGVRSGNRVWEDGIIPYYIDPELQPYVAQIVKKAVHVWNQVGAITLIEINPYTNTSPEDYLHFTPATGCASWVGRQGGAQEIWTAPTCSAGTMIHEIGHALGLEHEHTRPDRDQYISIKWDNINPDKLDNFDISDHGNRNIGPYDYASIMHYGEFFFSATGLQTIEPLNNTGIAIGQRLAPSMGDIQAISALYGSDISLVSNVLVENGQSEVTLLVTNESQQGANNLTVELQVGQARLLSSIKADWTCATYDGILQCRRERLSGQSQSTIVLLLDQPLSESDLKPSLLPKRPDANLANNDVVLAPAAAHGTLAVNTDQPYADQQLQGNAGSLGFASGALLLMGMVRLRRKFS